jgi:hypothetical protein
MEGLTSTTPIDQLLAGIQAGSIPAGIFSPGATLDATVPNWRFSISGGAAVRAELGQWYANAGRFEHLQRTSLPDGELVEFTLTWEEQGVPHTCHQAHILRLVGDRVGADTAFCGGRWPASLLAQMKQAPADPAAG